MSRRRGIRGLEDVMELAALEGCEFPEWSARVLSDLKHRGMSMTLNEFTKLASAMAKSDEQTDTDEQNLSVAQCSDALAALADVAVNEPELFAAGWASAVAAATRRSEKD